RQCAHGLADGDGFVPRGSARQAKTGGGRCRLTCDRPAGRAFASATCCAGLTGTAARRRGATSSGRRESARSIASRGPWLALRASESSSRRSGPPILRRPRSRRSMVSMFSWRASRMPTDRTVKEIATVDLDRALCGLLERMPTHMPEYPFGTQLSPGGWWMGDVIDQRWEPLPVSTSGDAMLRLVAEMATRGFPKVKIETPGNMKYNRDYWMKEGRWYCWFFLEFGDGGNVGEGDTMAECVARAALAALGGGA